jgi:transposase-like protein
MDPTQAFCPKESCPARGQAGKGNITIHSLKEHRYRCSVCRGTFSARKGTVFYRRRTEEEVMTLVVTLVAHGCPVPAIEAALGLQGRTVRGWVEAAGAHCERVHQEQVVQPRDLGQVQADEIRAKVQRGVLWLAMAVAVPPRLWLGGVVSPQRDKRLIRQMTTLIAACARPGLLLVSVDGLSSYVEAVRRAFRTPQQAGRVGRPRLVPWPGVVLGQVLKQYARRRVIAVAQRLVQGTAADLATLLATTQGGSMLNTAYIERLNATFRARLALLTRRTRALARRPALLHAGLYLVGTIYNFCTAHASLTAAHGTPSTPAMAAGITDHCWTVAELLWHRVPPPRWAPPKKRGRRSKEVQRLIEQWAA